MRYRVASLGMLSFVCKAFHQQLKQPRYQACLARKRSNEDDSSSPLRIKLDDIESKVASLHGQRINCNSPKQVSFAIFGNSQSVSRDVLQTLTLNSTTDSRTKQLAELILEYRKIQSTEYSAQDERLGETAQPMSWVAKEPPPRQELSDFDRLVESSFLSPTCKVDPYWKDSLRRLTRPSARQLVSQLNTDECPMGYNPPSTLTSTAGKKGTFLAYCREQKERYPECIVLTRCGDFYETFGIDAILLVEHCGLNSMGGKAKAGCPIKNVQATLDGLTEAGFRVAVYEEGSDTDSSSVKASAGSKSRIKSRFLAQIVSTAAPTYLYDLVLQCDREDVLSNGPQARPYVGVLGSKAGYTVAEVSVEERSVRISERLTAEAVACRLACVSPIDPLIYVPSPGENTACLPFLSISSPFGQRLRTKIIPSMLVQDDGGGNEFERVKSIVVSELLKLTESHEEFSDAPSTDDFIVVSSSKISASNFTITNPLYLETATQLGLMDDKAIPSLVSSLLPASAPAATRRFLRRYLLTPPPPSVAESLSTLILFLKNEEGPSIPPLSVPPLGKVLSMLRAGQASAQVFSELLRALHSTILILDLFENSGRQRELLALTKILEYESGMASDATSLRKRCFDTIAIIEQVLCSSHHVSFPGISDLPRESVTDFGELIPQAFAERNESPWRGRVREDAAPRAYARVEEASKVLLEAVAEDFWGLAPNQYSDGFLGISSHLKAKKCVIVQDIFNNLFALKGIPPSSTLPRDRFFHPHDRNGKLLQNRYTTERVRNALRDYVGSCEEACDDVAAALVQLSTKLYDEGHIPSVVQSAHANLILSTTFHHAIKANSMGWNLARAVEECEDEQSAGRFRYVWPYWMDASEAVPNSFDLKGMWVLTAPNVSQELQHPELRTSLYFQKMSGKSTLMRSTAASALLTICGLCAPLRNGSVIRRFDNIFVRGASSDVPAEGKSAFGAEMGDVAAMLRSCGSKSLVFVDELSRGTSPQDGTRLSAAVLEAMAMSGMSGIFATHLHDILSLPLRSERLVRKRMAIQNQNTTSMGPRWTYMLEDGVCTDSMALVTAAQFGLPPHVIQRAEELAQFMPGESLTGMSSLSGAPCFGKHDDFLESLKHQVESITESAVCRIPPGWNVPARYDGKSCLYVLQLHDFPPRLYVGESDDVRKRLFQHRSKGENWKSASALIATATRGKSEAREWETKVIRRFAARGYVLESVADGRNLRVANRREL